jgi:hypothetical protein
LRAERLKSQPVVGAFRPRRPATIASRVAPPQAFWPALPTGRPAKGVAIPEGFYVQVRYPRARRWVTLAVSDLRPIAAGIAADGYRDLRNGRGEAPRQVRVVTPGQLRREGGRRDVTIADADVARGGAR